MSSASCVAINMYVSQCSAGHVVQKIFDWRRVLKFVAHPTARLNYSDIEGIMKEGLHEFIDSLQLQLNRIDDAIHETFFALPKVSGSDSSPLKNLGQ